MKHTAQQRLALLLIICLFIGLCPITTYSATNEGSKTGKGKTKIALNTKKTCVGVKKSTKLVLKNAKASKVKWSSKKKKIATVSKKGVVKGRKKGTTTITAKYKGKKYTCKVTVIAAKDYTLSKTKLSLKTGGTAQLTLKKAKAKKVKWTSSDTKVAAVSGGLVTAKKSGAATITANYYGLKYKCKVTVTGSGDPEDSDIQDRLDDATAYTFDAPPLDSDRVNKVLNFKTDLTHNGYVYDRAAGSENLESEDAPWYATGDPKNVYLDREVGATIGDLDTDGFSVEIPGGALPASGNVSVCINDNNGISIELEGYEHPTLQKAATVSFRLREAVSWNNRDQFRGTYVYRYKTESGEERETEIYYLPDPAKLKEGILSYTIDHFSDDKPVKIKKDDRYYAIVHAKAIERYLYDSGKENAIIDNAAKTITDKVLNNLGINDTNTSKKFRSRLKFLISNSGNFYTIGRTIYENDENTVGSVTGTLADMTLNALVEDAAERFPGIEYLGTTVSTLPSVYQHIRDGDRTAAMNDILEALASTRAEVAYVQMCNAVVEASAEKWTDANMEEMYQLYRGRDAGMMWRKTAAATGFFENNWQGLQEKFGGAFNAYITQKEKAYAAQIGVSYTDYYNNDSYLNEREMMRKKWLGELKKEFDARAAKETAIAAEEEKISRMLASFEKYELFDYVPDSLCGGDPGDSLSYLLDVRSSVEKIFTDEKLDPAVVFGANKYSSEKDRITDCGYADIMKVWLSAGNNAAGRRAAVSYVKAKYAGFHLSSASGKLKLYKSHTLKVQNASGTQITKNITWESNNSDVVSVKDGTITANWPGGATIYASYAGLTSECVVTVPEPITISKESVTLDKGDEAWITLLGKTKKDPKTVWTTSNSKVAVYDGGYIKAKGYGEATITARLSKDGCTDRIFTCLVSVPGSEPSGGNGDVIMINNTHSLYLKTGGQGVALIALNDKNGSLIPYSNVTFKSGTGINVETTNNAKYTAKLIVTQAGEVNFRAVYNGKTYQFNYNAYATDQNINTLFFTYTID